MDLAEGEEAVAVAAVVDERCLQRRLDPGHLGEVDVTPQQLAGRRFVVELLYPAVAQHHDPGFLRMRGVDEHLVLVVHISKSLAPKRASACRRLRARPVEAAPPAVAPMLVAY